METETGHIRTSTFWQPGNRNGTSRATSNRPSANHHCPPHFQHHGHLKRPWPPAGISVLEHPRLVMMHRAVPGRGGIESRRQRRTYPVSEIEALGDSPPVHLLDQTILVEAAEFHHGLSVSVDGGVIGEKVGNRLRRLAIDF